MTEAEERAHKIQTSRHAAIMPTLVKHLIEETSLSADECLEFMEVAKQSRDEHMARLEIERLAAVGLQKERAEHGAQIQ